MLVKGRFDGPDESQAGLAAARRQGFESSRLRTEDAFRFDLDFVQHPVATSIAATVACGLAAVLVGLAYGLWSMRVSAWTPVDWSVPLVSGLCGAVLGAAIALVICRSGLREYRHTRQLTVVAVSAHPDDLQTVLSLLRRSGAVELHVTRWTGLLGLEPGHSGRGADRETQSERQAA